MNNSQTFSSPFLHKLGVLSLITIVFFSACRENTILPSDLIPPIDNINTFQVDTLNLSNNNFGGDIGIDFSAISYLDIRNNYDMRSIPDVIFKAAGNVHYHDSTSPSYGQPSDYTQGPTIINYSDIELEQNIAKYTKAALSAVIVWAVPACKLIATVLAGYIIEKATTDEKKAKSLSVKTEINYHKKSKAGWLNGDYCRQLKAKWYYEKGYKKYATKGTVYKCGYVIN